jgi:transposase InsO family protein
MVREEYRSTSQGKVVYVATVEDLFTRKVVGVSVYTNHSVQLTMSTLMNALLSSPRPEIFHSDNGTEYNAEVFTEALKKVGVLISRSALGCPWENGYQESFYDKFKVELGDPSRFKTLGELVFEIYRLIHYYNQSRIHSALKMAPVEFAKMQKKELESKSRVSV